MVLTYLKRSFSPNSHARKQQQPHKSTSKFDSTNWFLRFTCLFIWPLNRKLRFERTNLSSDDFDNYAPECTRLTQHSDSVDCLTCGHDNDSTEQQRQRLNRIEVEWNADRKRIDKLPKSTKQVPSMRRAIINAYGLEVGLTGSIAILSSLVLEPSSHYYLLRMIDLTSRFEAAPSMDYESYSRAHNSSTTGTADEASRTEWLQHQQMLLDEWTAKKSDIITCAILLVLSLLLSSLFNQLFKLRTYSSTLQMKNYLSQMIYKKALKIQRSKSSSPSISLKKQIESTTPSTVKVNNNDNSANKLSSSDVDYKQAISLVSRDLERLIQGFCELPWMLCGPVECLTISTILTQSLGLAPVLVVFCLAGAISFQRGYMNIRLRKHANMAANHSDERVALIHETVCAIRVLRMYTWTSKLMQKIEAIREKELSKIKRTLFVTSLDQALFFISCAGIAILTLLISFALFGTSVSQLSVSQVFLISTIYRRTLSRLLPQGILALTNLMIIFDRIGRYLNAPEIRSTVSSSSSSGGGGGGKGKSQQRRRYGSNEHTRIVVSESNNKTNGFSAILAQAQTGKTKIIELKQVSARWAGAEETCLQDVSLQASLGELVIVAGRVGCGKSSLLQIILGELALQSGSIQFNSSGCDGNSARSSSPKIAYAPQEPWIFTGTVRDNILFGQSMDLDRYIQVLRVCCLLPDLISFNEFDRTDIGERGVTLSGGQKARINLARALYQQVDLYLLDDPLSAVDAHVARHIFHKALKEFLSNETVILVTHQLQFARLADKVLLLSSLKDNNSGNNYHDDDHDDNDRRQQATSEAGADNSPIHYPIFGTLEQLSELLRPNSDWLIHLTRKSDVIDEGDDDPSPEREDRSGEHKAENLSDEAITDLIERNCSRTSLLPAVTATTLTQSRTVPVELQGIIDRVQKQNIVKPVLFHLRHCGNFGSFVLFCVVTTLCRICFTGCNLWLNFWANFQQRKYDFANAENSTGDYGTVPGGGDDLTYVEQIVSSLDLQGAFIIVGMIWSLLVMVSTIRSVKFFRMICRGALVIHSKLMHSILYARMTFFDNTPHGNLINRVSADIGHMDSLYITQLDDISQGSFASAFLLAGIFASDYKLGIGILLMLTMLGGMLTRITDITESVKKVDGTRRNAIYSHVSITLDGLAVIRAAQRQDIFMQQYFVAVEKYTSVTFLKLTIQRLVAITAEGSILTFYVVIMIADVYNSLQGRGQYSFVGLNAIVQLTKMSQMLFSRAIELITTIQSIDRIRLYCKLDPEESELYSNYRQVAKRLGDNKKTGSSKEVMKLNACDGLTKSSTGIPLANFQQGAIEFIGVSFQYEVTGEGNSDNNQVAVESAAAKPLVLRDVSFKIEAREKIGIVGRTGAGKSSLIAVLFHLYHFEGFVVIDGQQTKLLELDSLRRSLSIIPQDPVLFSGSLRQNLDPLDEYTDSEIWRSLECVQLRTLIAKHSKQLDMQVNDSGDNFSVGQRQLICLARAILRRNKILVLDEATANVDLETDQLIQKSIRSEFADCTVLTVAHRLNTIVDSDRILVLDNGRLCELDSPKALLANSNSLLSQMVASTGKRASEQLRAKIMNPQSSDR